ncbi:MAG: phosphate ABC transporter substrate-binding protein [Chloroflexi bacterium RBG_16_48_8]|nr:MAG: phosphate ABC transporter substrate-binding protein [Chloroflexi bacterium RBG_16_48_8]
MKKCKPLSILLVISSLMAGCASSSEMESIDSNPQQTITISGAWALYPMMVRWAEEFHTTYPQVEFDISAGGAGKGMVDALAGAVDIGMVSRKIYQEEIEKGAFWVSVTRDAVFVTVNELNPVLDELRSQGISQETLVGIYITGEITTWGQVVGQLEIQDPVNVYTRSDAAGAPATFAEYLGKNQEDLLGIGVYGDPGVLDAVIKDPLGIGYNNLTYAFDASSGKPVQGAFVVPLDVNANGIMDPEEWFETKGQAVQAVAGGYYPAPPARDLNLVTLGKPTGVVRDFIEWVLTDGQGYVNEVGYIGLSREQLQMELTKIE